METMKLLVSVSNADEAADAILGGADIIDAKDPDAGPLGPVSPPTLRAICLAAAPVRPVSAAMGDAEDVRAVERAAAMAAGLGVSVIKLGFAGRPTRSRVGTLLEAALRGTGARRTMTLDGPAGGCAVFAVAYADWRTTHGPSPETLLDVALHSRASGVLIDTADKAGPGLQALIDADSLVRLVRAAHEMRLQVAIAGKLGLDDVPLVANAGADIMGVRGAVCEGGRTGRVNVEKVRRLAGLRTVGVS
jgi:uncharacterized protein (UPF0264 family)